MLTQQRTGKPTLIHVYGGEHHLKASELIAVARTAGVVAHADSIHEGVVESEAVGSAYPSSSVSCAVSFIVHLYVVLFTAGTKDTHNVSGGRKRVQSPLKVGGI